MDSGVWGKFIQFVFNVKLAFESGTRGQAVRQATKQAVEPETVELK